MSLAQRKGSTGSTGSTGSKGSKGSTGSKGSKGSNSALVRSFVNTAKQSVAGLNQNEINSKTLNVLINKGMLSPQTSPRALSPQTSSQALSSRALSPQPSPQPSPRTLSPQPSLVGSQQTNHPRWIDFKKQFGRSVKEISTIQHEQNQIFERNFKEAQAIIEAQRKEREAARAAREAPPPPPPQQATQNGGARTIQTPKGPRKLRTGPRGGKYVLIDSKKVPVSKLPQKRHKIVST